MPSRHSFVLSTFALGVLGATASLPAQAQTPYPSRPITIVVPFSAGGGVDAVARLLGDRMRVALKQSVVVENKGGASGMLGAAAVSKAAPDGYTLLMGSAGETAINPLIYKQMQYQPEKDLAPISLVTRVPNVLLASPTLPVKNVEELVTYAKAHPGVTYGTSGVGNPQHLNGELLASLAGVKLSHVPYKGASAQLVDVASGNVNLTFVSMAGALPFIKGGRVKPLAVTSAKRASFAPDIPAIAEYAPLAAYTLENWFGLFAPAGTPADVQVKLNTVVNQVLRDPEVIRLLQEQGGEATPMTQDAFRDFIKTQTAQYARIVKSANITAE
ncbi:Bug family tripartite tricarboxylate transporter substrate binding protein [Pigmentiphaga litoralis]|uniref:Tripartite-type tricarboxylate transporter receptor subunit TctC n=1 Tax=Pigmentiphaga litoralis TaxID=516702 RepID=A0A7Y9IY07_9BURK|nr:tripartite tricarboxylate transporter substrate binding protein [Pigmentiphaga litoralis]NYE21852.1 tripartite-type tricarboxylate transporter receptor subunit TctC [Pigmentiphaga litoralis]NYE84533.1 tripartite-type tricarboxylate transporter receptor subunit TctC [Pigmentiphaga litoralis]